MVDTKDVIRRGIRLATQDFRLKDIAQAIGCSPQHLSTFMSGGPFGSEFTESAQKWLKKSGFWEVPPPSQATPTQLIAQKLRALADFLDSPFFPAQAKVTEFAAAVKSYYDSLDSIVAAMNESAND